MQSRDIYRKMALAKNAPYDAEGRTKKAWLFDEHVLLKLHKGFVDTSEFIYLQQACRYAKQKNVNTANTIDFCFYKDDFYILQDKVEGESIASAGMAKKLAEAPQEHYDKFVNDVVELHKCGLNIDTNPNNFLYDDKKGFGFVDLFVTKRTISSMGLNDFYLRGIIGIFWKRFNNKRNSVPQNNKLIDEYAEITYRKIDNSVENYKSKCEDKSFLLKEFWESVNTVRKIRMAVVNRNINVAKSGVCKFFFNKKRDILKFIRKTNKTQNIIKKGVNYGIDY